MDIGRSRLILSRDDVDVDGVGGKRCQIEEKKDPTRRKKDRERNGAARGCQSLLLSVTQNCLTGGPASTSAPATVCSSSLVVTT